MPDGDLTPEDLAWLQSWLQSTASLAIRDDQLHLVQSRLTRPARAAGVTVKELVSALRRGDPAVTQDSLDALTTNETSWFRDPKSFNVVSSTVLPTVIEENARRRSLSVWSAGSSSGQELYSTAILCADKFPELSAHWSTTLLGTDVSRAIVAKARTGRYSQMEVDRGLPARYLVRYFERDGLDWCLAPAIRDACAFRQHNLVTDTAPGQFDIIFCRYVLIYFNDSTRAAAVDRLAAALRPGGFLILGAGEIGGRHFSNLRHEVVDQVSLYRKA